MTASSIARRQANAVRRAQYLIERGWTPRYGETLVKREFKRALKERTSPKEAPPAWDGPEGLRIAEHCTCLSFRLKGEDGGALAQPHRRHTLYWFCEHGKGPRKYYRTFEEFVAAVADFECELKRLRSSRMTSLET